MTRDILPPGGDSKLDAGLRFAARMADERLDDIAGRFQSIVTVLVLSFGGAFVFVFLPRAIFYNQLGATVPGTFAVSLFAAALIAGGLYLEAQGSGGWGAWFGKVALAATGVALLTTLFALALGQPAAWIAAGLLWVAFVVERLYMRLTSLVVEKVRRHAAGAASKTIAATFGNRVTADAHDEIRRLIEGSK